MIYGELMGWLIDIVMVIYDGTMFFWYRLIFFSGYDKDRTGMHIMGITVSMFVQTWSVPSGKRLHSYWKWPFIVDLPI